MSSKAETIRSKFVNEAADLHKEFASLNIGSSKAQSMNQSEYDAMLGDGAFDILGMETLTTVKSAPQLAKVETKAAPAEPVATVAAAEPAAEHVQEAPLAVATEEGHSMAGFFQTEQPAASNRNLSVEMFA
ncbi:MAG: hypothetical protein U0105_04535 [Candidatus Obscuribacterales bacterium]